MADDMKMQMYMKKLTPGGACLGFFEETPNAGWSQLDLDPESVVIINRFSDEDHEALRDLAGAAYDLGTVARSEN